MPYLTKKAFNRLQMAGNIMSNICFNLSQQTKTDQHAKIMKEAQVEWDAAKEALRQEFVKRSEPRP